MEYIRIPEAIKLYEEYKHKVPTTKGLYALARRNDFSVHINGKFYFDKEKMIKYLTKFRISTKFQFIEDME